VGARTRWRDNLSARPFKYSNGVFCNRACLRAQPCIEVGLSAAGLVRSELDAHTQLLKNVDNSLTRLRVERIDEAGDEKLDSCHPSILSLNQTPKFGMIATL